MFTGNTFCVGRTVVCRECCGWRGSRRVRSVRVSDAAAIAGGCAECRGSAVAPVRGAPTGLRDCSSFRPRSPASPAVHRTGPRLPSNWPGTPAPTSAVRLVCRRAHASQPSSRRSLALSGWGREKRFAAPRRLPRARRPRWGLRDSRGAGRALRRLLAVRSPPAASPRWGCRRPIANIPRVVRLK